MSVKTFAAIDVGSFELTMKIFDFSEKNTMREIDCIRQRIDLGSGSNPIRVVYPQGYILIRIWDLSSAGRASALQAEGHRFESYRSHLCRCGSIGRAADL